MTSIAPRPPLKVPNESVHEQQEREEERPIPLGTTKEWKVPPRPKPGRKPGCDVNPDKRKIQNRVAQKLFRERKAARTDHLREHRRDLEAQFMEKEGAHFRALYDTNQEKKRLEQRVLVLEKEVRTLHSFGISDHDQQQMASPAASPGRSHDRDISHALLPLSDRCGICSSLDECVCANSTELGGKRTPSPTPHHHPTKRSKQSALEIDFTGAFARPNPSTSHSSASTGRSAPHDSCGFCSTGTPCVCKEEYATTPLSSDILPPLLKDSASSSSHDKPEALHPGPTIACCRDNYEPGSCAQCKADPMSTLFCQTLARHAGRAGGKCASDPNRMCTKSQTDTSSDFYIPCSAAYQTLSRHQGFNHTSLSSLVGGLSRRGCEVEVGSVQNVLKELDKKLYS